MATNEDKALIIEQINDMALKEEMLTEILELVKGRVAFKRDEAEMLAMQEGK